MSYEHLDLDITNYTLQDMLDLLGLPQGFTKEDLRQSMKTIAALHPDKSGAPVAVYQLFYQAHLQCRQLLSAREQGSLSALARDDYKTDDGAHIANEMTKREDFNKWFNESFEEFHKPTHKRQGGHGEWLASDMSTHGTNNVRNLREMADVMSRRRKEAAKRAQEQSLMLMDGPIAAETGSGTLLVEDEQTQIEATSGQVGDVMFSDLRHGYEETIVPIDEQSRPEYSTLNELVQARGGVDEASAEYWRNYDKEGEGERALHEQHVSTDARMFALQKQQQEQIAAHNAWRSKMLALTK